MSNPQSEKRRRRKKRLLKKRMLLLVTVILLAIILFFGVKAILNVFSKDNEDNSSSQIINSDQNIQDSESDASDQTRADSSDSSQIQTNKPELSWSTTLVNVQNPLPVDFTVEVRTVKGTEKQYDARAAEHLEQMLSHAQGAGFSMYLVSTYRTVEYQQGLFNRKVNEYKNSGYDDETARAEAAKWVAIPGTSEHNLGLAADIVSSTWYNHNSDLTQNFEDTEHFKWLIEHCTDYGFILRFPKGKESITGIAYEPWHYRYVGVDAAKYIMENSLTLEEFHEQYSQ